MNIRIFLERKINTYKSKQTHLRPNAMIPYTPPAPNSSAQPTIVVIEKQNIIGKRPGLHTYKK